MWSDPCHRWHRSSHRDRSCDLVPGIDTSGGANADYYARRSAGGVGLIVTKGAYIGHPAAGYRPSVPRVHDDDTLTGWRRGADAVHAEGGRIAAQLWHVGSMPESDEPVDGPVHSPSGPDAAGNPAAPP